MACKGSGVRVPLAPPLRKDSDSAQNPNRVEQRALPRAAISGAELGRPRVGGHTRKASRHQVAYVATDELNVPCTSRCYVGGVAHGDARFLRNGLRVRDERGVDPGQTAIVCDRSDALAQTRRGR